MSRDLKEFVNKICLGLENKLKSDLSDIIGIDENGRVILFAEIKFEGFGKKAREEVLNELKLANRLKIPYYLVIPKKPVYGRELSDGWIKRNLPEEMKIYKFALSSKEIIPKQTTIKFIEIKR
ncbi:MAG: hypothetical protein QXD48_00565 [Candidatus Aenigmatarchaeota archaeon]